MSNSNALEGVDRLTLGTVNAALTAGIAATELAAWLLDGNLKHDGRAMLAVEPWELLWDRAMLALDSLRGYARIDWAFGGGTAMRLFFDHRESKDIDIFLNDAMVLNGLSPRVNDTVAEMNVPYNHETFTSHLELCLMLKLAAPGLQSPGSDRSGIAGRQAPVP